MRRCAQFCAASLPLVGLFAVMLSPALAGPYDPIWVQAATSNRAAIEKALNQPAEFELSATPLASFIASLRAKYAIEVQLDYKALEEAGVDAGTPLSRQLKYLTLRSALGLVLRDLELTSVIRHGVLLVTTISNAETMVDVVIYPVDDLILPPESLRPPGRRYQPDYDSLIEVLASTISPTTWGEWSGPAPIHPYQGTLVIPQTQEVHAEIAEVLAQLRAVRDAQFPPPGKAGQTPPAAVRRRDPIRQALRQPADFELVENTLPEIARALTEKCRIAVQVDAKALEEAGVKIDEHVTRRVHGVALRDALDMIFHALDLTWTVVDDVLLITSQAQAETMFETRVYPIAGLGTPAAPAPHRPQTEEYDTVQELLMGNVAPAAWAEIGGVGAAKVVPYAAALVVSQMSEQQEQVAEFLDALRKSRGTPRAGLPAVDGAGPGADELVTLTYRLPGALGWRREIVPPETPASAKSATAPAAAAALVTRSIPPTPTEGERIGQQLAAAISKFVEPKSWESGGGQGTITVVGDRLLIRQRMAVHDQVADFFEKFNGDALGGFGMGGFGMF